MHPVWNLSILTGDSKENGSNKNVTKWLLIFTFLIIVIISIMQIYILVILYKLYCKSNFLGVFFRGIEAEVELLTAHWWNEFRKNSVLSGRKKNLMLLWRVNANPNIEVEWMNIQRTINDTGISTDWLNFYQTTIVSHYLWQVPRFQTTKIENKSITFSLINKYNHSSNANLLLIKNR